MPLLGQPDASIYENVQPVPWPGQAPQGRQAGPNAAMARLGLEEQENDQIRQLAQQYGSDYDGLADAVTQLNPERGMKLRSALENSRKEAAARSIEETKGSIQKLDMGARWLQTAAEQPDLYPVIRGELLKQAGPQGQLYDKVLPQPGDPDLSDKLTKIVTGIALPTKDYLETKAKASQLYFDGKKVEGALTLMAGSKTPEQWQHTSEIVKGGGLGKLLETVQTPEAAQAMLAAQQQAKPDETAPKVGTFEDYVTQKYGPRPTPDQVLKARKEYNQADDRPRVSVSVTGPGGASDVKETILGMKDGSLPPVMPGRGSKEYTALMAEAHRQGFDLSKANQDWVATQKYLSTLNGAQQTRLRQATEQVSESVPLVRSLVTEWDSAGIPALSAANLKAAKAGTYGNKAQSLAVRLDAQIADMVSELGTVYKGGNSSTDESLRLAAQNLSGSWSKQAALDALTQIEKNISYRKNSMRLPAVTGHEDNPYAPPSLNQGQQPPPASTQTGPEKMVKMRAPGGQTKMVPESKVEFFRSKGAVVVSQ